MSGVLRDFSPIPDSKLQYATERKEYEPGYIELSFQVIPDAGFSPDPLPTHRARIGVMPDGTVFANYSPEEETLTDQPAWKAVLNRNTSFCGCNDAVAAQVHAMYAANGAPFTAQKAEAVREFIMASLQELEMKPDVEPALSGARGL